MKYKYTQKYMALILAIIFIGGILYAKQYGYWQTESSKTPEKIVVEGEEVYNPEDIRGSYSFEDVSKAFDIPIDVLIDAFELPEGTDGTIFKNKNLEELYGEISGDDGEIGNGSMKVFVAFYKNIPMELEDGDLLLETGSEILRNLGTLTDEQLDYIDRNTLSSEKMNLEEQLEEIDHELEISDDEAVEEEKIEDDHEEFKINGNVTFVDLENVGFDMNQVEEVLGMTVDNKVVTVRDFCSINGISFSTIKAELTEIYEEILKEEMLYNSNDSRLPATQDTQKVSQALSVQDNIEVSANPIKSESIYNDGKYVGTGTGYRSGLEVEVEIKNGEICNMLVLKEREDEEFYMDTFTIMEEQIICNQSIEGVQGITGATCTADGFKEAVDNALQKALK